MSLFDSSAFFVTGIFFHFQSITRLLVVDELMPVCRVFSIDSVLPACLWVEDSLY